jgi:hypothetical protein
MPRRHEYDLHISVRVTRAEWAILTARARAGGRSLSRYLAEAGLGGERPPDPALRAERERALFHLRKVGVNLNQLVRRLHSGGGAPAEHVAATLTAVTAAAERLGRGYREGA